MEEKNKQNIIKESDHIADKEKIKKETAAVKQLIDKNIDVFKRLAKK